MLKKENLEEDYGEYQNFVTKMDKYWLDLKKEEKEAKENEDEKSKSEYRAYNFETSTDSWKDLGVQRSSFVQYDIEAKISNTNFGHIKF